MPTDDSQPPAGSPWATFWKTVIRYQPEKVTPWLAFRNAIGIALPLIVGAASGSISSGVVGTMGALNVAFSDSDEPYAQRGRRMLTVSGMVAMAVFAGALCARSDPSAVVMAAAWAFPAGLLVALGSQAADVGAVSLIVLVVFSARPLPPAEAAVAGLFALAGGLFQTCLSLALWPIRRHDPERRALGNLFLELSRSAVSPVSAADPPPSTAETTQAQTAIAALDNSHSIEAERYRMLLSQAERIRLSRLALGRLRARLQREAGADSETEVLDLAFAAAARLLDAIGHLLLGGDATHADARLVEEFQRLTDRLSEPSPRSSPPVAAMAHDARLQLDALAGQLRSALDLANNSTPAGLADFARREAIQPWQMRLTSRLAKLRANLTLDSAALRHAVRLSLCIALGDGVARGLEWRRSYWVPMTIAIVLKPDFSATFSRGVLRLAGTLAGLILSTTLFYALPASIGAEIAQIALLAFVLRCFGGANYGIAVIAITALVVLLFAVTGVSPAEVVAARGLNTVAGGALALFAYWIWPTWERTQVPEAMAQMLDAYRRYFQAVRQGYFKPQPTTAQELDRARVAGRLARTNLEASVDRAIGEPGTSAESARLLNAMLAASHRLGHAMMALESGVSRRHGLPARSAFRTLSDRIEVTLHSLAAALRGSPLTAAELPNLREDHLALVRSGDSAVEQYAFVNVETDRMVNSLNTLSEEVLEWIASSRKRTLWPQSRQIS